MASFLDNHLVSTTHFLSCLVECGVRRLILMYYILSVIRSETVSYYESIHHKCHG